MIKRVVLAILLALCTPLFVFPAAVTAQPAPTTFTYSPQFLDSLGNPLANVAMTLYVHGSPEVPANVAAVGTTDGTGHLSPVTLQVNVVYDFVTNSPVLPRGSFLATPLTGYIFTGTNVYAQVLDTLNFTSATSCTSLALGAGFALFSVNSVITGSPLTLTIYDEGPLPTCSVGDQLESMVLTGTQSQSFPSGVSFSLGVAYKLSRALIP